MEKVNDQTFEAEVMQAKEKLVVVDFGATWCGPCKKLDPMLEELAEEYGDQVKVRKLDVGEAPATAQKFQVLSVPRVFFIKDGMVREQITGLVSKQRLIESFDQHLEED